MNIVRFYQAPKGFEINALQGAFIIEGAGVEGGLDVRTAEVRGGRASQSGRTIYPRLLEAGWVPGFREDQMPRPSDPLLEGKGRFVVFPVDGAGWKDDRAWVVELTQYTQAWNAWRYMRKGDVLIDPTSELLAAGIELDVIRLARNCTREWPGSNPEGAIWVVREAMDLVEYHNAWLVEEENGRTLVYCPDRAVVVNCPSGFEFPGGICTAYGLTTIEGVERDGMQLTELMLRPDEDQHWAETLWVKVWRGGDWALFPVEELMFRTGSPFPGPASWPKWEKAMGSVPEAVLNDPFGMEDEVM